MKRSSKQFLAMIMLVSALSFASCTKDAATSPAPAKEEAAGIGSSAQSSASSESGEFTVRDIEVELNDIGRRNLLESGRTRAVQRADGIYVTDVNNPWGPWDPPMEPIICDGMTYSQLWADIDRKLANLFNSPQGQALQAQANATCRPVFFGVCNCGICLIGYIMPEPPCGVDIAEELSHTTRIKAQLFEPAP
jgi:hypothetical protein